MKNIKFILLFMLLQSLYSCNNDITDPVLSIFPKEYKYLHVSDSISLSEQEIFHISDMKKYGDWFIFELGDLNSQYMLCFYNYKTKDTFKGLTRGRGPEELLQISSFQITGNHAYFYGFNEKKCISIDLDESIRSRKIKVNNQHVVDMSTIKDQPVKIAIVEHGFIGIDFFFNEPHNWYSFYNENGKVTSVVGLPEFEEFDLISPMQKHQIISLSSFFIVKPDGKKVVCRGYNFGALSFCNVGEYALDEYKRYIFNAPELYNSSQNNSGVILSNDNIEYFAFGATTESHVYFTYSGNKRSFSSTPWRLKTILEFDWKGNPTNYFILERPISSFYVDEKSSSIWAIDEFNEEIYLLRFDYHK